MKIDKWRIVVGLFLIFLSFSFYVIHFLVFRDPHHLFIFLVGDIAFVFIEVLMVTMLLHELLNYRERKSMLVKLNMVIGAFYSEVGTELLRFLSVFDINRNHFREDLILSQDWSQQKFEDVVKHLKHHKHNIDVYRGDLEGLKAFLLSKRNFLLSLLQNPNLLEHDTFTDLLWAVFHLAEELESRKNLKSLPRPDYVHIANDIQRADTLLITEWLSYMKHLKQNYPYLYSLAMRTNPFDPNASAEIRE